MASQSILVVDDTPINLKLIGILLNMEGYQVHTAQDAEEALSALTSLSPSMILMDIQLPRMDGLELTRKLKQSESTQKIPVVALTAYAMEGDEEKAFAAGCCGYITKPIDTRTFGKTVAKLLTPEPGTMPFPVMCNA